MGDTLQHQRLPISLLREVPCHRDSLTETTSRMAAVSISKVTWTVQGHGVNSLEMTKKKEQTLRSFKYAKSEFRDNGVEEGIRLEGVGETVY